MIFKNLRFLLIVLFVGLAANTYAQNDFKSEDDLRQQAALLFQKKDFIKAAPLYSQLLSLYPKDGEYNYKYGACLLQSDGDKSKAIKYLDFAVSRPNVDNLANYYMGLAYHYNYEFPKAIKYYNKFKAKASTSEKKEYEIDQQIEMVKNGNEQLKRFGSLNVVSKESISKDDFFRIYDLEGLNGKIVVKPDEFKTKYDKKNDEKTYMYLPNNAKELYFSSYGKDGKNGLDIFKVVKLGNDEWSDPVNLGPSINTPYDENFAFILPDGRSMYFSSKGHNSIGGYDLFKTTYDASTDNWKAPINLDFPFSTVNDDIMFVTNDDQSLAYFASDRNTSSDLYNVYKVSTAKKPADLTIIKGKFIAEDIPELKSAKITVVDVKSNETVGVYKTDDNGNYSVEIEENGGTYKFNIETTDNAPIHAGTVTVPKQNEYSVLGQELRLVGKENDQKLVIKNIFDGSVDLSMYSGGPTVSAEMLSKMANLETNASEKDIIATKREVKGGDPLAVKDATETAKNENVRQNEVEDELSNSTDNSKNIADNSATNTAAAAADLSKRLNQLSSKLATKQEETEQAANFAYRESLQKSKESLELFNEAEKQNNAAKILQGQEQQTALKKAEEAERKAKKLATESKLALAYAEKFDERATDISEESNQLNQSQALINQNIQESNFEAAEADINKFEQRTKAYLGNNESVIANEASEWRGREIELETEVVNNSNIVTSLSEQLKNIDNEIVDLEKKKEKTNNKKELEKIDNRLSNLNLDKSDLYVEIEKNQTSAEEKQSKLDQIAYETAFAKKLSNAYANNSANSNPLSNKEKEELDNNLANFNQNNSFDPKLTNNSTEELANNTSNEFVEDENINFNKPNEEDETIELVDNTSNQKLIEENTTDNLESLALTNSELQKEIESLPSNKSFELQIESAQSISNSVTKERELMRINQDWSKTIDKKIELNQLQKANARDEAERNDIENNIAKLEGQKAEVNEAIEVYKANTTSLYAEETPKTNAINYTTNVADAKPRVISNPNKGIVEAKGTAADADLSVKYSDNVNYNSPEATTQLQQADQSKQEAKDLINQYNQKIAAMSEINSTKEREEALDEADGIKREAAKKQLEVAEVYANLNQNEYQELDNKLTNYPKFSQTFRSQNLDVAELLAADAEYYFNEARQIREAVNENTPFENAAQSLQKAYNYELTALQKQSESIKALQAATIEFNNPSATATQSSNKVIANNSIQPSDAQAKKILENADQKNILAQRDLLVADSLKAEADVYEAEVMNLKAQLENTSNKKDREVLEARIVAMEDKQQRKINEAQVYYRKARLTESSMANLEAEVKEEKAIEEEEKAIRATMPGTTAFNDPGVDVGTVNLSQEEYAEIKTNPAFVAYANTINERNQLIKEANVLYATIDDLKQNESANKKEIEAAQNQIKIKTYIAQQREQKALGILASTNPTQALKMRKAAAVISGSAQSTSFVPQDDVLAQKAADNFTEPKTVSNTNNTTTNSTATKSLNNSKTNTSTNLASNTATSRTNLTSSPSGIFKKLAPNQADYSKNNPIPINTELPSGIIYKVQVGAFRNPIPQDLFKGFTPLMGEKLPNGITRYTAGIFTAEDAANAAKNEIRNLGYTDAFVVAFKDGKRISIAEAKSSVASGATTPTAAELEKVVNQRTPTTTTANPSNSNVRKPTTSNTKQTVDETLPSEFKESNVAEVKNAEKIDGVYLTIQVGVYSKPLKVGELNIDDLNVTVVRPGVYRYSTGIFRSLEEAAIARAKLKSEVPDAFVAAYNNGKKISLSEALKLLGK